MFSGWVDFVVTEGSFGDVTGFLCRAAWKIVARVAIAIAAAIECV